jgi:hypothetical protein
LRLMRTSRGPIAALSSHTVVTGLGITLLGLAVLAVLTPRIAFNDGLGNDGSAYASVTEALRGNPADPQWAGFAYRLLPSAIVALMPVDVVTGFLIVNILAILASAILLLRLLDRYSVRSPVALLALVWWMTLPMGPRWHIYYPVLGDAFGFFVLLALFLCAVERRLVLFAAALVGGVLARENLAMAIPFLWRAHVHTAPLRWSLLVAIVSIPAVAALVLVRVFPPVAPTADSGALSQTLIIALQAVWIIQNHDGQAWRVLLSAPLSLGLLLVIPLVRFRETARFLSTEMQWLYFVVLAVVVAVIGGRDTDRYLYVLAPLLLILTFVVQGDLWRSWPRAAALTTVQLIALRVGWPIGTSEYEYLQYTIGFMQLDRLVLLALLMALASAIAASLVWSRKSTTPDARLANHPQKRADAVGQAR